MTTLKNPLHDSNNGLDYTLVNDYYLPNLTTAAPAEQHPPSGGAAYIRNICKNIIPSGTINCSCPVSWAATLPLWTNRQTSSLPLSSVRCRIVRLGDSRERKKRPNLVKK